MPIEIRTATQDDDLRAALETITTAFLDRPDIDRLAEQISRRWERDRAWLALDGTSIVGTFRTFPTEITLPGLTLLPAAAVAAVTVLPTHRRQGILTRMAAAEHAAMRERGEPVALLYASEFGIYGHFGYGPSTRWASWSIDRTRTSFVPGTDEGTVELVRADADVRDAVRALYDAWRRIQVAELRRRDFTWDVRLGLDEDPFDGRWKGWLVLHRDDAGRLDGFLRYKSETVWSGSLPQNKLIVQDLFGLGRNAEQALWRYLMTVDLVTTVRAEGRPVEDAILYLVSNPRAIKTEDLTDGLWVRVIDVPRALAARGYEREGSVILEVVDPEASGGRWRVALDASAAGATCVETTRSADLTIPVTALGSVYLGAHDLRDIALRTGADEHAPGAMATAAALFRAAREPWCSTFF